MLEVIFFLGADWLSPIDNHDGHCELRHPRLEACAGGFSGKRNEVGLVEDVADGCVARDLFGNSGRNVKGL
jgi:hypothetical protein